MAIWQLAGTGNWSNPFNWAFSTPPNLTTFAGISLGNVVVDTTGLTASDVFLSGGRTVDVGAGGGLTVAGVFSIASGSGLVVHDAGAVFAGLYSVSGTLVIGGAIPGVSNAGGTVLGVVSLASGGRLIFNTNDTRTFANAIVGAGSVEQNGAGSSVTLSGANIYDGATTVSAGVLRIAHLSALGSTAGGTSVAAEAALEVQGGISVAEALTLNGTGVSNCGALRNISGDNIWSGAITLGSQTRINSDAGQLILDGDITGANQNLILGGVGNLGVLSNIMTSAGSLTKDGPGVAYLFGVNTYTGVTTVNAGTLSIAAGVAIADTGAVIVNSPGVLHVEDPETIGSLAGGGGVILNNFSTLTTGGDNTNTTFSGVISNPWFEEPGNLTKIGTGTFTLSGANTYDGVTTVSAGVLRITNANALGTAATVTDVAADAALEVLGDLGVAEELILNGTGVSNGGALRSVSGENTWSGLIRLGSEARINVDAGELDLTGSVTGLNQNLILGGANGDLIISSAIQTGGGNLTKDGTGTVTLSGANTYTGVTTVNDNILQVVYGAAIADTGAVVVNAPGDFWVASSETIGSLAGGGGVTLLNASTLTTGGDNTSTTFSGVISVAFGTGSLTKIGAGTFTLSGANAYDGVTNVSAGVLRITNNSALGTTAGGTSVAADAALEVQGGRSVGEALTLNGTGVGNGGSFRSLSGVNIWSGAITLGSEARINVDADELFITGGITGAEQNLILGGGGYLGIQSAITTSGSLTKDGAGTVVLSGANTFFGATTVNAGALLIDNGAAISDMGAVVVNAPGEFQVFWSETIGSLTGSGRVVLLNGSVLTTGGDNEHTTFSGVISNGFGSGDLTKTGIGAFTLSGANTYVGVTTITEGALQLAGAGTIASSSNVVIASDGTFDISAISGASASIRDVNFAGPGSVGSIIPGGKTLLVTHANGDFGAGVIKGSAAADALSVTMDAAAASLSLAGLAFDTWSDGVDRVSITGNALANTITGSARADIINGGAGADALNGGGGQDAADYSGSTVGLTVDLLTPASNTGEAAGDTYVSIENIRGSGLNDTLRGNAGNNIINGGAGTDGMSGRGGDDTYIVDNVGDRVYESTTPTSGIDSGGLDTVFSSVTITLDGYSGIRFVERLTLTAGAGSINGFGNALANVMIGNSGNNTLDGGLGNDTMLGGGGNDIYVVESASDQVFETTTTSSLIDAGGIDIIQSSVTMNLDATAGVRFVERLTLTGTGNINATGNALANVLLGNSGNNTLNGGLGIDIMGGGAGNDIYVVDNAGDRVFETTAINTLIDAGGIDTMQSSVSTSIDAYAAVRFIERLTLTGTDNLVAVGNALDNVLLGNTGNNTLNGGLGSDTMGGGAGNDIYIVDNIGDRVFETTTISTLVDAGGVDTIQSSVALSLDANAGVRFVERLTLTGTGNINGLGNGLANVLIGNSGNNALNGGLGADIMGGGAGNDIYVIDNIGDFVFETTTISTLIDAGGIDTVQSSVTTSLDAGVGVRFVENLTLTGTANIDGAGNALANALTGNSGNNTLNGGLGDDTMIGGAGNDIYVVDSASDTVFETTTTSSLIDAGGIDTIQSSVTTSLDAYAAVRFVENLTLTGTGKSNAFGNGLDNMLIGNAARNTLNGGLGNDTMIGGGGDDIYVVDSIGDQVFETTTTASLVDAGGVDLIESSVSMSLDGSAGLRFVERLTLTGTANIDGVGNALDNVLTGNFGNNTLNGGLGNDLLIGSLGNDTFVFNTTLGLNNIDQIASFSALDDTIRLDDAIFVGLAPNILAGIAFAANLTGEAATDFDRIIYETDTGALFYDSDGVGTLAARVQFATLSSGLALTNSDFFVF